MVGLDEQEIVRVLTQEHRKLAAYSWQFVRDEHLVEEVLQEVAMIALRKRSEIRDETHCRGWLLQACRNISRHIARRERLSPVCLGDSVMDLIDEQWSRYQTCSSADIASALQHCIGALSPYRQELIQLKYQEGLPSREIAVQLERKVESIYVALTRAHQQLRECMDRRLGVREC